MTELSELTRDCENTRMIHFLGDAFIQSPPSKVLADLKVGSNEFSKKIIRRSLLT